MLLLAPPAQAARLVLKIQAANPNPDKAQPVDIHVNLPARVTTNDIINLAGLNLGYDVKSDTYYVHGVLQLAPKEIAVREVELNDIWTLDENDLKTLTTRSAQMSEQLAGSRNADEAAASRALVDTGVAAILARQAENRITQVSQARHIQAYESNLKALQEVKQQVGQIENLVLGAGMNPGETLVGADRNARVPRRDAFLPAAFGEAVVKITVKNSSSTQARKVNVNHELPPEVTIDDVIDGAGLQVRYDAKQGVTCVYTDALEIGPLETKTFDVRIRDKWNVNRPRMDYIQEKIGSLRSMTAGRNALAAVDNMLNAAAVTLETVMQEQGPDDFTPAYIAFYRRQADRLDAIEQDLNRIDAALKPLETNKGFRPPAPDKKTTWLIIYGILGFLGLFSLLFFLRWFVKSS